MCYIIMYQYRHYLFLSYMDYSIVHVKHSFVVWNIPVVLYIPLWHAISSVFIVVTCSINSLSRILNFVRERGQLTLSYVSSSLEISQ
jgi:hypothetical protein